MIAPGTYETTEPRTWSRFVLHPNGAVTFTDARDGHSVQWSTHTSEGRVWLRVMRRRLAAGTLVRVTP